MTLLVAHRGTVAPRTRRHGAILDEHRSRRLPGLNVSRSMKRLEQPLAA